MKKQLRFSFEEGIWRAWINSLSDAQKGSIKMALKEIIIANFKKEGKDGKGED